MSKFRAAYTALNSASPRSEVLTVLVSLITGKCSSSGPRIELTYVLVAQKDELDAANRAALVQTVIDDIALLARGSRQSRLTVKGAVMHTHWFSPSVLNIRLHF